jgi:arylsulfatase A-like enzyme
MERDFPTITNEVDQPCAALIADLKDRGMLHDTLVVWGGEFGRTPYLQGRLGKDGQGGRDHHPNAFTFWMAGGGVKPGMTYGQTDDIGYHIVNNPVHVHDFHATMLYLLGIDHERFTYRFQGRDFRLTDVSGKVVKDILAHQGKLAT